jgi:feruloyl esterase
VIGETDGVARSRLLCPYPQIAKYKGSGDVNDAGTYYCE